MDSLEKIDKFMIELQEEDLYEQYLWNIERVSRLCNVAPATYTMKLWISAYKTVGLDQAFKALKTALILIKNAKIKVTKAQFN